MDKENEAIKNAKNENEKYESVVFENGDTQKKLLARCRYILAKKQENWTFIQQLRAAFLFTNYPHIQHAYHQTLAFRNIRPLT